MSIRTLADHQNSRPKLDGK